MGNALAQDAHGRPPDPLELEFPESIYNTKKEKRIKQFIIKCFPVSKCLEKEVFQEIKKECFAPKLKSKIKRIFKQTEKSRFWQWLQNFQQTQKNFPGCFKKLKNKVFPVCVCICNSGKYKKKKECFAPKLKISCNSQNLTHCRPSIGASNMFTVSPCCNAFVSIRNSISRPLISDFSKKKIQFFKGGGWGRLYFYTIFSTTY